MMLPPTRLGSFESSRLGSFESTRLEETTRISLDKNIFKLESFLEEPQIEILVDKTIEELLELMKTFPVPPSNIETTPILPPPASVAEPSPKAALKVVMSGGLSAMKNWWGNRRVSKGGSAT